MLCFCGVCLCVLCVVILRVACCVLLFALLVLAFLFLLDCLMLRVLLLCCFGFCFLLCCVLLVAVYKTFSSSTKARTTAGFSVRSLTKVLVLVTEFCHEQNDTEIRIDLYMYNGVSLLISVCSSF